jgi:hypothetical protein
LSALSWRLAQLVVVGMLAATGPGVGACDIDRSPDLIPELEDDPCCNGEVQVRAWLPVVAAAAASLDVTVCYRGRCWGPQTVATNQEQHLSTSEFPFETRATVLSLEQADVDPECPGATGVIEFEVWPAYVAFERDDVDETFAFTLAPGGGDTPIRFQPEPRRSFHSHCRGSECEPQLYDYVAECQQ